jgi:hypothetical protein
MSADELLRDVQAEMLAGADAFDRDYFRRFGRFPEESQLTAVSVREAERRARIQALAEQGSTEGERAAARAALHRFDSHELEDDLRAEQDRLDEEEAAEAGML